ncbi:MAG: ketoacyl-ACP synthase III [Candidatus Aminicenantes bacterium]|nr:MAG: ketoacyl-ACP synthase III [Candidatus Aminicenantes bacterium]
MDRIPEINGALPLKVAGMGRYLPKKVVSSRELEMNYRLTEGWCRETLGVSERRWVEDETSSFMGAEAAKEALAAAQLEAEDLDLIVNASGTASFERLLPDGGPMIQQKLGLDQSGIPAFTMQNNCSSFMLALYVCAGLLASGRYENILVVSSEVLSRNLDTRNPKVYGLFGDGAAAAVINPTPGGEPSAIHQAKFETYGQGASYMKSLWGLTASRIKDPHPENLTLQMDLEAFTKYGSRCAGQLIDKVFQEQDLHIHREDIKLVIPQQAGKAFLDFLKQKFPDEKILRVVDRFGFCGAASLPMTLYEAVKEKKLQRGDLFLMIGVGAGLSVGGMIMTY